jgi:hypothetical protein
LAAVTVTGNALLAWFGVPAPPDGWFAALLLHAAVINAATNATASSRRVRM